ncbi:MAG: hypothetical protein WCI88_01740 [Chloroflexota bacterium]
MRIRILKAGTYNDKNRHAHLLKAGEEFETGERYGASLITSQYAELVKAIDRPNADTIQIPAQPVEQLTIEVQETRAARKISSENVRGESHISGTLESKTVEEAPVQSDPPKSEILDQRKRKVKELAE